MITKPMLMRVLSKEAGAVDDAIIAAYSLGGNEPNAIDRFVGKRNLERAFKRVTDKDFDVIMSRGSQPRILIDNRDLAPQILAGSHFSDGGPAIPKIGQTHFQTWRKAFTYDHLHRHPDFWSMHRDLHPSLAQKRNGKAMPGDSAIDHVLLEGVPGAGRAVASRLHGGKITDGHTPRFSLFRNLGLTAPRSRLEFLTNIYDNGTGPVDDARSATVDRLKHGLRAAAPIAGTVAAAAAAAYLVKKLMRKPKPKPDDKPSGINNDSD